MSTINLNGNNPAEASRTSRGQESGRATTADAATKSVNTESQKEADQVKVSDRAATVSKLVKRATELPEVRQERVEALRASIQSGSYHPQAKEIANAILKKGG